MNPKLKKIAVISVVGLLIVGVTTALIIRRRRIKQPNKPNKPNIFNQPNRKTDKSKNYIIGDSQTPFIDKNSTYAKRIGETGSEANLWKGGMGLKWLKNAVDKYPISEDVNAIIINIGTNGGYNPKDDITGLVNSVKNKFPNAMLFAVQGSWGWGGIKDVKQSEVTAYYNKFKNAGVEIIEPPIGSVKDPHSNLPVYAQIGKSIDKKLV